jgi:hypothetical protein
MSNSDKNRYGFEDIDASASVFAVKSSAEALFNHLSDVMEVHSYTPNALGTRIKLFPAQTVAFIYQYKNSDWTIVAPHYGQYFWKPDGWIPLVTASIRIGSAVIFGTDDTDHLFFYLCYREGILAECIKPDSVKIEGYEDFRSLSDLERFLVSGGKQVNCRHYFHHINNKKNVNDLVIGHSNAFELMSSYLKNNFLYVPCLDLVHQPMSKESVLIAFEDVQPDEFVSFGSFYIKA